MNKKSILISSIIAVIVILGIILFLFRGELFGDSVGTVEIVTQRGEAKELKGYKKADADIYEVLSDGLPIIAYAKNTVLKDVEKKLGSGGEPISAITTLITTSDEIQIHGRNSDSEPVVYSVYKEDGTFVSKDTVLNIPAENLRSEEKITDSYIIEIDIVWDEENEYVYYFKCNLT